ncbi:MAG: HAMP domain-containing protein, partial [Actinomycetota bacterium]|nr:HAMP domain-containing protein [Actinomycetota bacterium]
SQKMALEIEGKPVRGEFLRIGTTVNTMVDQLSAFADEVTRVAREVGIEGRLGGQADVPGASGTWKHLTDNVNQLADNLTNQVRNIAQVTTAVAQGDLTQKITVNARGEILELKSTVNTMVDQLSAFAAEVTRVARDVGTEGKLGGQAQVRGVSGTWKDLTDNVNQLADNLTGQVRNIAQVTTAVAKGDLTQKITVEARGEVAELKDTVNTMVDQLSAFGDEVTRVAREVGTEGKLGGQAVVKGVSGTWKDLTDSVNSMADNLTLQVRDIAAVTTAVATGDLSQKISVDVRGELLELKRTINTMVDQLSAFAGEVTRVAREVGTEGKLGGQAEVKGVSGTWKDLTDNVNQLADNLTGQVRAIAEVSGAVTHGDLTRSITVDAPGEVGELKDTINQMIANLRGTTQLTQDQDWLKTNLARISAMLQGHRDLRTVSQLLISELTPLVNAQHGAFFMSGVASDEEVEYRLLSSYGFKRREGIAVSFKVGESLVGQAAFEKKPILVADAPEDYIRIASGLGEAAPANVIVLPVLFEDQILAVIELAAFRPFSEIHRNFLEQIVETVGVVLSTIIATMRTEELLKESQRLTQELQSQSEELQSQQDELRRSNLELEEQARSLKASEELLQTQQEELQQTNAELEEKAAQLAEQNSAIEVKNTEIELARSALEERAEQLALSSRYKSEFLANMSHELRTPLNSLLILARLLGENNGGNLSEKQIEFAQSIHGAGTDLLNLISDILDLSKVEAGKMEVSTGEVSMPRLSQTVQQMFRPLTDQKGLTFEAELADGAPASIVTDEQRLLQVLNNLLGNAVKFTDKGTVRLRVRRASLGNDGSGDRDRFVSDRLRDAESVLAFEVSDTGIGIPEDKLMLIFEAFQQADGTTSRKYGGTGLGLSISREIARLLGGEIQVRSTPGEGSTFTLFLPEVHDPADSVIEPRVGRAAQAAESWFEMPDPLALPTSSAIAPDEGLADDRVEIVEGDRVLLLVGAEVDLLDRAAEAGRERGFRILVAGRGDSALAMAREYRPDAIVLDAQLPGVDGLAILEELKRLNETRHIPVHIISSAGQRQSALSAGAIAYLEKPVSPQDIGDALARLVRFLDAPVRRLLVVEDDERERSSIIELIGGGDNELVIVGVGSSEDAIAALESEAFDCMVLDLKLPKTSGFGLLE